MDSIDVKYLGGLPVGIPDQRARAWVDDGSLHIGGPGRGGYEIPADCITETELYFDRTGHNWLMFIFFGPVVLFLRMAGVHFRNKHFRLDIDFDDDGEPRCLGLESTSRRELEELRAVIESAAEKFDEAETALAGD